MGSYFKDDSNKYIYYIIPRQIDEGTFVDSENLDKCNMVSEKYFRVVNKKVHNNIVTNNKMLNEIAKNLLRGVVIDENTASPIRVDYGLIENYGKMAVVKALMKRYRNFPMIFCMVKIPLEDLKMDEISLDPRSKTTDERIEYFSKNFVPLYTWTKSGGEIKKAINYNFVDGIYGNYPYPFRIEADTALYKTNSTCVSTLSDEQKFILSCSKDGTKDRIIQLDNEREFAINKVLSGDTEDLNLWDIYDRAYDSPEDRDKHIIKPDSYTDSAFIGFESYTHLRMKYENAFLRKEYESVKQEILEEEESCNAK